MSVNKSYEMKMFSNFLRSQIIESRGEILSSNNSDRCFFAWCMDVIYRRQFWKSKFVVTKSINHWSAVVSIYTREKEKKSFGNNNKISPEFILRNAEGLRE